jgi:di/tricarboxylate transporter
MVAAIFVLSAGLHRTGVAERLGRLIGRWAGDSWVRAMAVIMPSVALLSAFTHHVTTTAVMLPVTLDLARGKRIPASRLLMPLSFAASLGTTITIIGAPAFLIASESLRQAGRGGLGLFSLAPIGLVLSAVGTLFVLVAGRFLLPDRTGAETGANHFRLEEYFTELTVRDDSPFRDKLVHEIEAEGPYKLTVVGVVRQERRLRGSRADTRVKPGDVLLVRTTPEDIAAIRKEASVELHPVAQVPARAGRLRQGRRSGGASRAGGGRAGLRARRPDDRRRRPPAPLWRHRGGVVAAGRLARRGAVAHAAPRRRRADPPG